MKRFNIHAVAVAALLAVVACAGTPALAASKCDNPGTAIEKRACAKAAEGPDALRRFVERTRAIYALYYADFAPGEAPRAP